MKRYGLFIDSGMSASSPGAFCFVIDGEIHTIESIPGIKPQNLLDFIYATPEMTDIIIEKPPLSVGPNRGASSVKLNAQYHYIIGYMVGLDRKFEEITPQKWQRHYDLPKLYKDKKQRLYKLAKEGYPDVKFNKSQADSVMIYDSYKISELEKQLG